MTGVSPHPAARAPVLVVSSNKGGVGKTTLAANLAIYARALREDLPVLILGLDDQKSLDRMFALRPPSPGDGNLKHGWAERSLTRVIQLGQYGVHFVPSPPDVTLLKGRAESSGMLRHILDRTGWEGLVVIDTKSDLEALTVNAYHAADRIAIPVSDRASLEEAARSFAILERSQLGAERARIVLTLVDRRARADGSGSDLAAPLREEIRRRGWPCYRTALSRSPRVEALNSASGAPRSILHHARGTMVHREMRDLVGEMLRDLRLAARPAASRTPSVLWGRKLTEAAGSRS